MVQRRDITGGPRKYVTETARDQWPEARPMNSIARAGQEVAFKLAAKVDGMSYRAAGEAAGVNFTTIRSIVEGETWPDFVTLVKLSENLDYDAWPSRPVV